ncbi:MAG TPA: GNAT family N-acetyltransferase, partial [Chlamydiales bacterium]|nr:GNAT family N-acetyltransferase [Chlamydiales bacterium]
MYTCLKSNCVEKAGFCFRAIEKQAMEPIRLWRNAQIDVLRQKAPLTKEAQVRYFDDVILPSFSQDYPAQILWTITKGNSLIGYGALVHIDWNGGQKEGSAEISFLLDSTIHEKSAAFEEAFLAFHAFVQKVAFEELQFRKLRAEVYSFRHR